jgi:adenosylcobinamide-phosphate synthase
MKFLALVGALLLEQVRPLRHDNGLYRLFDRYAVNLGSEFNGSLYRHGVIAWLLAVVPVVAATVVVHLLLYRASPLLAWAWNVAVLYLTMGFRQFSHYFTEISEALQQDRLDEARAGLGKWRGESTVEFTRNEAARAAIELGLIGAHRHVFGPVACFIAFGAAGAVLYRLAAMLAEKWAAGGDPETGEFGRFAGRFFFWLDWLPLRFTAASFAIVGNFEDAVYCWRTQARSWAGHAHGIILASGAGAMGVRLCDPVHQDGDVRVRPGLGTGDEADVDYMQSAAGLIWRALVLWLFLVLLVTVARLFG